MNALEREQHDARLRGLTRAADSVRDPGTWLPSAADRVKLRNTFGISVEDAAKVVGVTQEELYRLESVDRPTRCPESYVRFVRSLAL